MKKADTVFKFLSHRVRTVRNFSKENNERDIRIVEGSDKVVSSASILGKRVMYTPPTETWCELSAVGSAKRKTDADRRPNETTDLLRKFYRITDFTRNPTDAYYNFKKWLDARDVRAQEYMPRRRAILRADLATAHFIVARGGAIQFVGHKEWVGCKEERKLLPASYTPGLFIQKINAEGTGLRYEGLANIAELNCITHLSLRGLTTINDACLDWVSGQYYKTLIELDISKCINVTYRALSCFYRFDKLKTLKVEGISDSTEFKLACIMLQDIMPELEIVGIKLEVPEKIKPVNKEEAKFVDSPSKPVM